MIKRGEMKKRSFEDYEEIALYLRTAIQLLHHVSITYRQAKFSGRMKAINQRLEKVKSDLETEMYRDYPERANTNVFYGGGDYTLNLQKQKDQILSSFGKDGDRRNIGREAK